MSIQLETTFEELFADRDETVRRRNWVAWKQIANGFGCDEDLKRWGIPEPCESCTNSAEDWCDIVGLPCAVNPVLSFRHGISGMACCGTRLVPKQEELALFAPARSV